MNEEKWMNKVRELEHRLKMAEASLEKVTNILMHIAKKEGWVK